MGVNMVLRNFTLSRLSRSQAELRLWRRWLRKGGGDYRYLLSDHVGIMAGLGFECTVLCPEIDRGCDAGNATLVDLLAISHVH